MDSKKFGFKTYVIRDGTKSVAKDSEVVMEKRLAENEVKVITSAEVPVQ